MKVAVFAGGVDTSATETKGTVLIHTAEEVNLNCFFNILKILLKGRKLRIYYLQNIIQKFSFL